MSFCEDIWNVIDQYRNFVEILGKLERRSLLSESEEWTLEAYMTNEETLMLTLEQDDENLSLKVPFLIDWMRKIGEQAYRHEIEFGTKKYVFDFDEKRMELMFTMVRETNITSTRKKIIFKY